MTKIEKKTVQTSLKLMEKVRKRKTKSQFATLLTEFSTKMASTKGRLFHQTIEHKIQEFNFRLFTFREINKLMTIISNKRGH